MKRTNLSNGQRVIIKHIPGVSDWKEHEDVGKEDTLTNYHVYGPEEEEEGREWFTTAATGWGVRPQDVEPVDPEVREMYSVTEIREAFAKHATEDDWGIKSFYESTLISALRGEYKDQGEIN